MRHEMVTEYAIELPYAWPPARGRVGVWVVRVVLLPIFVGIAYVFAHYPVDRYFVHTEGRVVDGWVAAVVSVGLCYFMLISDGSTVRADSVRLSIRARTRQHDYSWGDVAAVGHSETGLVVTDQQGERATIGLTERTWQAKRVRRKSPMVQLAADLERIRLQVHAPKNLTRQVRVGTARLTQAEWVYGILVALGAITVATLRTLGA
ncbi:hypothetical protein ACFT1B_37125 [Streptomyces griseoincarnatus]